MREKELRRYCRSLLRALDIRPPLRVDELCQRLGELRGQPIRLVPWSLPIPGPFGVWISRRHEDCIFYQKETTRVHQDHIILHEVGHIVADHGESGTDDPFGIGPVLPPGVVGREFRRTCYAEENELEAELVATIIQQWAVVIDYVTPRMSNDPANDRLGAALSACPGWA